ncbi:TPA: phage major capsid protein, partial [Klebsiella pneumoniae subsp. pneumoniae]|nr:phage major capsid protein [Klebsiella pneumoniae subsp. pneumoniae]
MPLLREEAEKLSNNELEQGVIETIIDRDDLFAVLPFMKINSKAYLYNREKTLSEATFIDVNDTITEGAATFEEKVAKLRILAGDVDVDKFLATTMADTNNQLAIQVRQKVKGLARAFRRNLIVGDSTTNNKAFDGIPKLMHDDQKIDISGASMTFSMFDELVDAVKDLGADCIMMRSEHLRAYRALLRTVNVGPSEIMMENFGRPMLCHNGVPFIVNDFIPVADSTKADIYCLHLSEENGVTGLYGGENAGIVVENIGT